ncbi:MAG: M56 family metallopeptidase, partial [Bryobacterales bacterium]|nr:M56 family metallopeptidase [Bryobacterales bacterium]
MIAQNIATLLLEHLAGASARALCLAVLTIALLAVLRPRAASLRHGVWAAVVLSMLALPFASSVLPGWQIPAPSAVSSAVASPGVKRVTGQSVVIEVRDGRVLAPRAAGIPSTPLWPRLLAGLYLAVLGVLLARVVVGLVLSARLAGRSTLIRDSRVQRILEEIAATPGYGYPPPSVRESSEIAAPVVAGAGGLVIILPQQWRAWDDWKLQAVLAHEFTHVRRGDWAMLLTAAINRCLFWFHPLSWWLEKQLSTCSELASDDAAASITGDPVRYAELLLEVSGGARRMVPGRVPQTVLPMASPANLSRRIHRLLDSQSTSAGILPPRRRLAVLALALPCFLAIAAAQLSSPNLVAPQNDPPDAWQWQKDGFETSADDAVHLERQLTEQPDNLTARARLIAYCFYNALPEPLANHVIYVIEHHPESRLAGSVPVAALYPRPTDPNLERKEQLWRQQAAIHHSHPRVLENAARFLAQIDQTFAEQLLQQAIALEPDNRLLQARLAALYTEALRGNSYLTAGLSPLGPWHSLQPSFAAGVVDKLNASTDTNLLGAVGASLALGVASSTEQRAGQQNQVDQARRTIAEHAERLLSRAQLLAPNDPSWPRGLLLLRNGYPQPPSPPPVRTGTDSEPVRVPAKEQALRL